MGLEWLTRRPIAHRGLHDAASGIIENTGPAFGAAITGDYGIECDVQISADGEAMVHHDDALGRLTDGHGRLADLTAAELRAVPFKAGGARILTLGELCDLIAGRVTLTVELKSRFDGDTRIARRTAGVLGGYKGPVAAMSFDPAQIVAFARAAPSLTRGIVAERHYAGSDWKVLSTAQRRGLACFMHAAATRPHFIAYAVHDLPALAPFIARSLFGRPLLTWTVRTAADRERSARYADQMIFEGFRP
jgi:glycerophosphoryl diester phosphodiesterase